MKPLPRFWTTADGEARRADGRQLRLRMWGWSTASLADAEAVAADRLSQARAKAAAGQELQSWAYYPRTPLREETLGEVLSPDGTLLAVVTRNRYGAEILNTDLLLIADIDLPESSASRSSPASGGGVLGRLFGRRGAASPTPGRSPEGASPEEVEALERVSHFGASRPDLGVHTYRTAAGLRVLVTGGDLPPGTPAAEEVLEELASDPVYVLLCASHETYRARLTPKPWRSGHVAQPVAWPYGAREAEARDWQARYAELSAGWATTRKLSVTGPPPSPVEQQVIDVHDGVSRATEPLPLA